MILRPGKTPSGKELRGHLRRLVRRVRSHWPSTRITIRGDGHYGRPEVMNWREANDIDYVFGPPGNMVLDRLVDEAADDIRTRRALDRKPCLRGFAETGYRAKSWKKQRRACARSEASTQGRAGDGPGSPPFKTLAGFDFSFQPSLDRNRPS